MEKLSTVYVVAPTKKLESTAFPTNDLRDFALTERVWLNGEGGISNLSTDDCESIAKICVLAYFLSFSDLDQLLEFPSLTVDSFDQFWTIRRLESDGKLSQLSDYARRLDETRFVSLGDSRADEEVKRLIGWTKKTASL
ncbi:MAG: hypothetical protein KDB22_29830 [Planctomycetales bacterium]|nr:hypothetical protein [Planctomycetales bacterium]